MKTAGIAGMMTYSRDLIYGMYNVQHAMAMGAIRCFDSRTSPDAMHMFLCYDYGNAFSALPRTQHTSPTGGENVMDISF